MPLLKMGSCTQKEQTWDDEAEIVVMQQELRAPTIARPPSVVRRGAWNSLLKSKLHQCLDLRLLTSRTKMIHFCCLSHSVCANFCYSSPSKTTQVWVTTYVMGHFHSFSVPLPCPQDCWLHFQMRTLRLSQHGQKPGSSPGVLTLSMHFLLHNVAAYWLLAKGRWQAILKVANTPIVPQNGCWKN